MQIMRQRVPGLYIYRVHFYQIMGLFLSMVACISSFNHLQCINGGVILIALRISSVAILNKLQNATEKVVFRTNHIKVCLMV